MSTDLQYSIGADPTEMNRGLSAAADSAAKFSGQIANKVGDKLYGLKDVSTAVATALGLNIQNIAENVARFFAKMSKAEEEAYKNAEKLSDQQAEASIKNMRARLTEEQRYTLAVQERDKLLEKINTMQIRNGRDLEKQAQMRLELESKVTDIQAYEAKQREESNKRWEKTLEAQAKAASEEYKASLEQLTTSEKIRSLKDSIAAAQAMLTSSTLSEKNVEIIKGQLAERQVMLLQAQNKLHEEQAKTVEAHIAAADKLAKLKFEALPVDKQILELEKERKHIVADIAAKKKAGEDTVYAEVALMENANSLAKLQLDTEEELANVFREQTDELEDQIEAKEAFVSISRMGNDYSAQSTIALSGILARLKAQLDPNGTLLGASAGGVTNGPLYSAYLNNAAITPEIRAIEAELKRRREVGGYADRYGEDAARYRYGDQATDTALRDMTEDSKRTRTAVEQISVDVRKVFDIK